MRNEIEKKKIGNRIRNIRIESPKVKSESKKSKPTLEDFAKLLGSNKSNVSRWERGLNVPNEETLREIARLGEISVDELLYGSSENYIRKKFDGLKNIDDELIPFVINGFKNSGNYYPTQKEIVNDYNKLVKIINNQRDKFSSKSTLAKNLVNTGNYLKEIIENTNENQPLIIKALNENKSAIRNFELYFEENIAEQLKRKEPN